MKAPFLMFHDFSETNGISKKIRYQMKALKDCGMDVRLCHYNVTSYDKRRWMMDGGVIANFGMGFVVRIWKRVYYSPILDYAHHEGIDSVYMRSFHNASPFTLWLMKPLKRTGAKVVMEVPIYPYDQEYVTRSMKFHLAIDRCFRHKLAKALDDIITFSNAEEIFDENTIRISNGIGLEAIPMKQQQSDTSKGSHLIGMVEVRYWHGFDRLMRELADYCRNNPEYKIYFHTVDPLSGEWERAGILPVIHDNHLEPYVLLHGPLHGDELDAMFEKTDFAIGSLGHHRSGITYVKTLKNREYATRGFAFTYSETDDDFNHMPYVWKVGPDELPMDIQGLIDFRKTLKITPAGVRESVCPLSWKTRMQKVIGAIKTEDK